MSAMQPGGGTGGGSVAAADITDATATGEALITAANAAAARSALDAQQDVFTTRGDLVRAGAGGAAERFAAATADTFVGGDGTDVVARTAAQVYASLGAYQSAPDTGWTDTGTVTHVASVHTFSVTPSGDSAALRATLVDPLAQGIELVGRLDYTTGVPATSAWTAMGLMNSARTYGYIVQVIETGAVEMYWANGGGWAFITATGGGAVDLTANTAWLRLVATGHLIAVYYATGASRPARDGWTRVGNVTTNAEILANGTMDRIAIYAGRSAAGAGTYTVAWSDVSYRALLGLVA